MSPEFLLALTMIAPAVGAALVLLLRWDQDVREGASFFSGIALFAIVLALYGSFQAGQVPTLEVAEPVPGLRIAFTIEPLGMAFALIASLLWPVTTLYAIGYMRSHHERNQTRFYMCFALSIAAVMGLAFSANLATLFVCYEALTLATWPLVTHANNKKAWAAGRVYLGILMGSSIAFLLLACLATYVLAGTTEFTTGGILRPVLEEGRATRAGLGVLLALFVFGTGKAAIMPLHRWLPNAMVAPTPVSALLHAVAVVKAGVFTILKVSVYVFGLDLMRELDMHMVLAYLAAFTVVAASIIALGKDNLKERLAYSTIGQLSYIILGAMVATPRAVEGAGLHIAAHAFGKITLFFAAGAFLVTAHKSRVSQLDGIGRRMPVTMACFLVGALCIVGLPPTGGMWSKLLLVDGMATSGHWPLLAALLLSSLLNVVYLLSVPFRAFVLPEPAGAGSHAEHGPAPLACRVAMVITASLTVLLFLYPGMVHGLIHKVAMP
ncbi:MAG: proton-conducting transporter membrane subunit [Planctomycetota bacterium]